MSSFLPYFYLDEENYDEYYGEYEYDYDYELDDDYLDGLEGRKDGTQGRLDGYQDNYSYATGDQESGYSSKVFD